ncbi:putative bifunctional diguanylate cyclase/phosphodiesterase [Vibrio aestuarianus]|uniref:cyclic-guanylate-specific phosphodiesterase n=1 Tax=Vibrio aestuarianus TaxID=28171 RepID=A0ABD7YJT2_9VIBR|nr:EAL domain-containing protein [Vibrio aestuarianus]MDE1233069.1 EAL domain-containing protein [Vibrio aestuarianus]MDE1327043.1 EAL domain-containing protein [Vibrio aestuarianus]MDE1333556.1 EAL domain-containing protein [Vibrio aestuarianus]MDE1337403.1 EAL domain-containing protein [Vibrio aestuarianus]WGK85298.1 EAL domain-containing protein [Vibrio aestuarianus]
MPDKITYTLPKLQEFLDSLEDHAWLKSPDGNYILCNKAVEKAWGLSTQQILGSNDYQLFDDELARKFISADQWVIDNKTQLVVEECSSTDNDQSEVWLETIKAPIYSEDGQLLGTMGMTRNVTRRRQLENQLNLTTQIFNHSREGVMITDDKANVIDVNAAFTAITGYQADEVIGRNPRILRSGHHDDAFYQAIWHNLSQNKSWKGEFLNRRKDGSLYPQLSTITPVFDDHQQVKNYLCVFEDISLRKAHEAKLEQMAYFDPLTELPNRTNLLQEIAHQIKRYNSTKLTFATLFLDIDHFKHINDSFGHFYGDQVLVELANRLKLCLKKTDHIARIGGDEFVILLTKLPPEQSLVPILDNIFSVFERYFDFGEESLRLSTSIGIANYPQDGQTPEALLKNADTAMYLAKKNGRNGYAFYSPELTDVAISRVRLQSALYQGVELKQFSLVYQPQFNLHNQTLLGFEALIRWHHPQLGLVSPDEFIPMAEKTGAIQSIGEWVLRTACQQAKQWLDAGYLLDKLSVNVSAIQLKQSNFIEMLIRILSESQLPAHKLEIEITEGFLIENKQKAIHDLQQIAELGVGIALDDFGTGYSSLSYLKGLPLQKLKIDRSFINDIPDDKESNAIVAAILAMGNSLSLIVTAEGIEDEKQMSYLDQIGCHFGQGYYLGRPLSVEDATNLLKKNG